MLIFVPMTTRISRRTFLGTAAALPLAASALLEAKNVPVGLELYSVRGDLQKDLLGTVAAVGKMGYQVVEFYSPYLEWTPERAREVRKQMDAVGLKCPSTHNGGPSFTDDGLAKAIELNKILGSKYIIMASAPRPTGLDSWKTVAERLTAIAGKLKPHGMATGYHNHQIEWRKVDGQRPMDIIAAGTPKDVVLQFDVGTCLEVGEDPIAWINSHPGRIKSVHCKDWSKEKGYAVAFGEGEAPWKKIFQAAEKKGGVEYYLVEQETGANYPQGGELGMVQHCLDNFKQLKG
jgi:sugar phosphate isomerase/epimerase